MAIKYPYTDFHEMNLDWLMTQMTDLNERMDGFVDEITADLMPLVQQAIEQGIIDATYDQSNETVVLVPGTGVTSQYLAKYFQINNFKYPVADAEARSDIQDLSVFVTPEMYGAAGDGVTDDTQAIQDAIDSAYPVYFSKTYLISSTLTLDTATSNSDKKKSLDFNHCKVIYTGTSYALEIGANASGDNNNRDLQYIKNLYLVCESGSGIDVTDYASYVRIDSCTIAAKDIGIRIGTVNCNLSTGTVITNSIIENKPRMTNGSIGVQVNGLDNSIINCNVFFFKHQIEATATGAGLYINMVHSLGSSPFDSVFFYDGSNGDNHLISCYSDTDFTIVGGSSVNGTNIVEDIYYYSYSSALVGQILFDTVKRHIIDGGVIASGNVTSLTGVTDNIYNSYTQLYGWSIKNVKFGGSYSLLTHGTNILFNNNNPNNFWPNSITNDKVLRIGYISGLTAASFTKISVIHRSSGGNPPNSFEIAISVREDTAIYKVISGTMPAGTKIYAKRVISTTSMSCWEICIQFAYSVYTPSVKLETFGTETFSTPIINPNSIDDYPTISDTTGYTEATAM